MGLNTQSDRGADLTIGPTDRGMVRIFISGEGIDLPLDFSPADARQIAGELMAAAKIAGSRSKRRR